MKTVEEYVDILIEHINDLSITKDEVDSKSKICETYSDCTNCPFSLEDKNNQHLGCIVFFNDNPNLLEATNQLRTTHPEVFI